MMYKLGPTSLTNLFTYKSEIFQVVFVLPKPRTNNMNKNLYMMMHLFGTRFQKTCYYSDKLNTVFDIERPSYRTWKTLCSKCRSLQTKQIVVHKCSELVCLMQVN